MTTLDKVIIGIKMVLLVAIGYYIWLVPVLLLAESYFIFFLLKEKMVSWPTRQILRKIYYFLEVLLVISGLSAINHSFGSEVCAAALSIIIITYIAELFAEYLSNTTEPAL